MNMPQKINKTNFKKNERYFYQTVTWFMLAMRGIFDDRPNFSSVVHKSKNLVNLHAQTASIYFIF